METVDREKRHVDPVFRNRNALSAFPPPKITFRKGGRRWDKNTVPFIYWLGQKVRSGLSVRCYKKPKRTFWPTQCLSNNQL